MGKLGNVILKLMASSLSKGIDQLGDLWGEEVKDRVSPPVEAALAIPELPDDIKNLVELAREGSSKEGFPGAAWYALSFLGGVAFGMMSPIFRLGEYQLNKLVSPFRFSPDQVRGLWLRKFPTEAEREKWFQDLRDQGFSQDRIEALKQLFYVLPTPTDIVLWLAREVFEPGMIEKYGLDSEWDLVERYGLEWFDKIGMSKEMAQNYWRAHWTHAAIGQVYAMLHRGLISDDDMKEYYRLVEIPEFWRDKLTELSWDLPNRIELRMMARYLDLDKDYLVDMLKKVGLKEEYRSDVADFMIVMGLRGYWSAMYRNGWMTEDEIRADMEAKKLNPIIADRLFKAIVKKEKPARVEVHRRLSRSLIIRGLKKGIIDREQAIAMLMRQQNYGRAEAEFIIEVEVGMEGSPETPLEYRKLVELYRKAEDLEYKDIPDDLIQVEKEFYKLREQREEAIRVGKPQEEIDRIDTELAKTQYLYRQLLARYGLT